MKKLLALILTLTLVFSLFPAVLVSADADPLSIADATVTTIVPKVDGKDVAVKQYTDVYVGAPNRAEDQKINIFVPEGAKKDAPIIFLVNNSGWQSNNYGSAKNVKGYGKEINKRSGKEEIVGNYSSTTDNIGVALSRGYVVVSYGCRSRNNGLTDGEYLGNSPATMTDTKAAIRYLRYNADQLPAGDPEKIVISGTSGGGALSAVIAASGNSPDYFESLYEVGAAGIEKKADGSYVSTIDDDVFATIAYCPITDLGHADAAYEWTFTEIREELYALGLMDYGTADYDTIMAASKDLEAEFVKYFNALGLKTEDGKALTTDNLEACITALMEKEIAESIEEIGIEQMKADIVKGGKSGPREDNGWVVFHEDGSFTYNYNKHLFYLAKYTELKPAPSFSNDGISAYDGSRNEDNLFGTLTRAITPFNAVSWAMDNEENGAGLDETGKTWDEYMATEEGKLIAKKIRMSDAISYLVDDDGDSAPYWYVRHGMDDRDTSFTVEATLYYAMLNDATIEDVNFEFAWLKTHSGDYDVAEAYAWLADVLAEADPVVQLTDQSITVDGEAVTAEVYNINGSNYFKLRDMAALLNGTDAQFSVAYDESARTVSATTGKAYTAIGGELVTGADKSATCVLSDQAISVDGKVLDVTVYNIGGNNFFKLRDLGAALGFGVDYDEATRTAEITTK